MNKSSWIAISNQPEKQAEEVFPEDQRARAVLARSHAKEAKGQCARAGKARGRARSNSRNPVSTLILIRKTSNMHGLLYINITYDRFS